VQDMIPFLNLKLPFGRPSSRRFLPEPFTWISIPAGQVTLIENSDEESYLGKKGSTHVFDVPAFAIAKYPVTNGQFAVFLKAEGYNQRQWWTEEGWQVKETQNWITPFYWKNAAWNKPNYPVVGVSWFEAVAFCLWLRNVTDEAIALPTEQQWQRAAQGNSNRAYPWGDQFDAKRCNFYQEGTESVTQFSGKGDSPFGVSDMSGNVNEWCLTDYKNGTQNIASTTKVRALRGGTWAAFPDSDYLRVDRRDGDNPTARMPAIGFRLSRS